MTVYFEIDVNSADYASETEECHRSCRMVAVRRLWYETRCITDLL